MIFGNCPHCDYGIALAMPEDIPLPVMGKIICENCNQMFWEYYSRIEPRAYLPEDVEVNEESGSVKIKEKK